MSNCLVIAYPDGRVIENSNRLVDCTTPTMETYEPNYFLTTELEAGFQMPTKSIQFGNQCLNAFDFLVSRMTQTTKRYQKPNKLRYKR